MNDLLDQLPPSDIDAERCAIGSFVLDSTGQIREKMMLMVSPESFLLPEHQLVFCRLVEMYRNGVAIDILTLKAELEKRDELRDFGGVAGLGELIGQVPTWKNGEHYATIVRDHHRRRWVYERATKAGQAAFAHDSDPIKIASSLKAVMGEMIRRSSGSKDRKGGASELASLVGKIESGERAAIDWPFSILSRMTKALLPGTVTMLCGTPGDGKTFLILSCLLHWIGNANPSAVFMLEGDRAYHLNRCLAVLAGDSRLLDDKEIRDNAGWAKELAQANAETMEQVGGSIFDSTKEECTLPAIGRWVEREASKHRILIVDPITLAEAGRDRYAADEAFMRVSRDAITATGTSLVLITHPKSMKQRSGPMSLEDLAGGAVYQRASETVLLLRKHANPKSYIVVDRSGIEQHVRANRELCILKARNGRGGGLHIAMDFNGSTLAFAEYGIIKKEEKDLDS